MLGLGLVPLEGDGLLLGLVPFPLDDGEGLLPGLVPLGTGEGLVPFTIEGEGLLLGLVPFPLGSGDGLLLGLVEFCLLGVAEEGLVAFTLLGEGDCFELGVAALDGVFVVLLQLQSQSHVRLLNVSPGLPSP